MSQLTGTANNILPPAEWRLGELGDVTRRTEAAGEDIKSIDDLLDYLKQSERDDAYATRLLNAVNLALKHVQHRGLNKQQVVAVEALRPNTIPTAIQNCMTSNFSNVHKQETVMALESYAQYGRWGVLLLLIAVVLKVLSWIINKGSPQGSGADLESRVESYMESKGEDLGKDYEGSLAGLNDLKNTSIIISSDDAKGKIKKGNEKNFGTAAMQLDALVSECKLNDVLITLSMLKNKGIYADLLERVGTGDLEVRGVQREAVRVILAAGLARTIYAPTVIDSIMRALPTEFVRAGIRLPSTACMKRFSVTVKNMTPLIADMQKAASGLKKFLDPSAKADKFDSSLSGLVEDVVHAVGEASTLFISQASEIQGRGQPNPNYYHVTGFISTPEAADMLIGYETEERNSSPSVYSWMRKGCFLSVEVLDEMEKDGRLKDDDYKKLLAIFQFMTVDKVDNNKVDISPYKSLLSQFEKLETEVKAMATKDGASKTRSPAIDTANDLLVDRFKLSKSHSSTSAFMAYTDGEDNMDIYKAFSSVLRLCRDLLKSGGTLQQAIEAHNASPYVKANS